MSTFVSPASEFPNDNPDLHDGAIWVCETPCAAATAEVRRPHAEIELAPQALAIEVDEPVIASPIIDDDDDGSDIEVVDDLDAIVEEVDDAEIGGDDPFSVYVRTMTDVMCAAGGGDAAAHLVCALTEEPTARAWRRIISGESEDFTACGAKSLDEWSAELVARLIAMPAKTDQLRRELRARGVAAFGIVI